MQLGRELFLDVMVENSEHHGPFNGGTWVDATADMVVTLEGYKWLKRGKIKSESSG